MRAFYLHGFASSAKSSKAAFFATRLVQHGIPVETPDFNLPEFSTLTITRMVDQVEAALERSGAEPAVLIGSSLGAFVAVQAALRRPVAVWKMILLAPALDFGGNRMRQLGDRGLDQWRRTDRLEVFHYAYGRTMPVHYELYADARRYNCMSAALTMPVQLFQGRRDDAVDPQTVEAWATSRSNVELHMLDDDHQLLSSLDYVWGEVARFLELR